MYDASTMEFFKSKGGCEQLIEGTYGSLSDDAIEVISADSIEINGDTANVNLANGDIAILKKQDGEWMMTLD